MKRILLPVDFSERSVSAAKYAAALAGRLQAELTVLHVAPEHAPYSDVNDVSCRRLTRSKLPGVS